MTKTDFKKDYSSFQEGAKRFEKAMQGIPDRVPVYAQMHEFAMSELGYQANTFYTTPEILVPSILEIAEQYGIDVGYIDYDVYNIEVEGLGQKIIFFEDHIPDVDSSVYLINGPDDLKKIRTPDFDTAGRFSKVVEMNSLYEKLTGLPILNMEIFEEWVLPYILRLREICGDEVYVPNWIGEKLLKKPEDMLALKLQASPAFLEGQDPDVAALGPEFYKSYAEKHDVPLVLGVGASFMDSSTSEEIYQRVKHYVEVGKKKGRFALYLCNLSAETPKENVKAAIEAINTYGQYK